MERSDDTVPLAELLAERAWVRRLARVLVRDESRAEDLEQEAWLCAMRSPPRRTGSVRAWLGRVLKNLARNQRRGEVRLQRREREAGRFGPAPGAEDVFRRADTHRRVVAAVFTLEEPYRSTLLLRHFEGLSFPEIAARMGTTADAARMRANRAAALLRERLDEAHGGDRALWCAALAELIRDPRRPAAAAASAGTGTTVGALAGGALVATKTKVAISVLFLLLLAGAVALAPWPEGGRAPAPAARRGEVVGRAAAGVPSDAVAAPRDPARVAGASAAEADAASIWRLNGRVLDPQGRPVAGATVRFRSETWTEALAGNDGSYRLALPPLADTSVLALAEGYACVRERVTAGAAGGEGALDLRLRPEFRIAGRVVDERGMPVEGVRVYSSFYPATRTAADGTFVLRHLDRAVPVQELTAVGAGYVYGFAAVRTEGANAEVEIILSRGARIRGRVTDATGEPVAGAVLRVWPRLERRYPAREDGRFELTGVAAGPSVLEVAAPGYASGTLDLDVPPSGVVDGLRIRLDRGRVVRGTVRNPEGRPIPGATVWFQSGPVPLGPKGTADGEGRFVVEGIPGAPVTLLGSAPGFLASGRELPAAGEGAVEVVLTPAAGFAGRVVDAETGEPVTRFRVRFVPVTVRPAAGEVSATGYPPEWTGEGVGISDSNGIFRTELRSTPGSLASFEVVADGYAPAVVERTAAAREPDPATLEIRLDRGFALEGVVLEAGTERPVEGAVVRVDLASGSGSERSVPLSATTDGDGLFRIARLPRTRVRVVVSHPDFAIAFGDPVEPDADAPLAPVRIHLDRGGEVAGTVLDDEGRPVAGADVVLIGPLSESHRPSTLPLVADENGRFEFRRVPSGEHQVSHRIVEGSTVYYRVSKTVRVDAGRRAQVRLGPEGDASVRGVVSFEGNLPGPLLVTLYSLEPTGNRSTGHRAVPTPDGRFHIAGLAPGRYRLDVYGRLGQTALRGEREFELRAGEAAVIPLRAERLR